MGKNMLIEALRNNAKDKRMFYSDAEFITYKTGFPTIDYYMGSKVNVFDKKGELSEVYPALGITGGCYITFAGKSATGKAQPLDTVIPTPDGDKTLGDLKIDDYVFDRFGNPTKVLGIFDQGVLDVYEITLEDGRKTRCNDEHIWSTCKREMIIKGVSYTGQFTDYTVREMMEAGLKDDNGDYKFYIPGFKRESPIAITHIEHLRTQVKQRCIYVDNEEHLYVTNDNIVTHNTTLAIQIASNIVRPFDNGVVIHYDIERSSSQTRCSTLSRFSIDEIREGKYILRQLDCSLENLKEAISEIYMEKISNPDKYRYNSGKKNELGEDICPYVPTCMIVDSIASVTSEVNPNTKEGRVKIGEISTQTEVMRLNGEISRFLKESLEMVKEANIIVFFINHIKQKPSVGFPVQADLRYLKQDENLPCGRALQYYSSLMVRLTSVGSEKYLKEEDGFDGYGIQWQFMKNRTNIDGKIVPLVFAPVTGYDSLRSSFMYAKGLGMIGGNKNGFYLTSNKDKKFKFATIHEDFKEDKELYKELYGAIVPELEKELSSVKPEELEVVDEEMDY